MRRGNHSVGAQRRREHLPHKPAAMIGAEMSSFRTFTAMESYPGGGHDRVEVIVGDEGCVLAIADGMGGRSGAAQAAEGWIASVRHAASERDSWMDSDYWFDVMQRADRAILAHPGAGETTAIVAAVTEHGVCGASVGD